MPDIGMIQPDLVLSDVSGAAVQAAYARGAKIKNGDDAVKAAKSFESVLLNKLMEEMQNTIPKSGLFEDSTTDQVQGIFWFQMAQQVADAGGLGLWKQIYQQMCPAENAAGSANGGTSPSELPAKPLEHKG